MLKFTFSERDFTLLIGLAELAGSREPNEAASALDKMRTFIDKLKSRAHPTDNAASVTEGSTSDHDIRDLCTKHGLVEYMFDENDQTLGSVQCVHCHETAPHGTRVLQPNRRRFGGYWKDRGFRGWTHIGCCQYWAQWGLVGSDMEDYPF